MNNYRYEPATRNQWSDFVQRQPAIFLAATLAGGFLLGYWLKGSQRYSENDLAAGRFSGNAWHESRPAKAGLPSSRLGATEEQIARSTQPSAARAVPKDEVSTTGTAYELDPDSITGG